MGTRHLICAISDDEYRIAQYGQWDGYPEGQGAAILEFLKDKQVIPICPELLAGMPSPRPPVEIKDARVIRKNGEDVTDAYCSGVQKAMQRAAQQPIDLVILKSRSPTCGVGQRYDGTFTNTLVQQSGLFAEALLQAGYTVKSSDDF